ncbi:MAG: alpha/beta fold hydrolase [Methanosphaera sp.]|uniref:alpha/beta hydrolase family protein n=1 Tax=Methanosphaera sp. TaxID=2666342 RepID=UPI0025D5C6F8|nr:alpha/beta fold hydrolase [Methanosphaera sp.]MCI5866695.1 alpha/beta fold hydrolase [Methanosphaera sp.]MDD6535172.1 alpha/beta fold hydrolase [Methanosphaera sp.]MDY3955989.1 alpha/beta fold hydrolase [Methanosphaera sp.]
MNTKEYDCFVGSEKIYIKAYLPDMEGNDELLDCVILSHGLSLNHTFMIAYAQKLQSMGVAAFVFDFRGGGYDSLSDGKICDMTLTSEVEDLECVIEFIKDLEFINNDSIYLAGHSQGGFISSLVANKRSDINALFLFAPAYVIVDDMTNTTRPKNVLELMPEHLGDTYINDALSVNLYDDIDDFKNHVIIFHGKKDMRVPISYAHDAFDAYSDCELIVFDDEEHRFTDKTKDIVVMKIIDFIHKNKK